MGMHMLLNFGVSSGTNEGWSTGSNETSTNSDTNTKTDSTAKQRSTSRTSGTTDNLTIEFRDKSIENLLEKISFLYDNVIIAIKKIDLQKGYDKKVLLLKCVLDIMLMGWESFSRI